MQKSNAIEFEVLGGLAVVRFTRPEIRNPLSVEVLDELEELVDGIGEKPEIERLVITGTGGTFASGADLREINRLSESEAKDFARRGQGLMRKIESLPIDSAAAIDGFCFGGALDLALACKRRIASGDSRFCHPGAGLGIITGWGGTQRLPRLIGTANALEMFFTAEPISADWALRIGLIDRISRDSLAAASS